MTVVVQCTDVTIHRQCSSVVHVHVYTRGIRTGTHQHCRPIRGRPVRQLCTIRGCTECQKPAIQETPTWEGLCADGPCCESPEGLGIEVRDCCCWLFVLLDACWPGPAGGLACPRLRPWLLASDSWGMANTLWGCDLKDPAEGAAAC